MTNNEELNFPFVNRKMLDFEQGATFSLLVNTISATSTASSLTIQGFTKSGVFKYLCDISAAGGKQEFVFQLPDIPIFISMIQGQSGVAPNNIWAMVRLRINNDTALILMQGYPNPYSSISWPNSQVPDPISRTGAISTLSMPNPAAGAEWSATVGANQRWEITGINCVLTASATVANRRPAIQYRAGGKVYTLIPTLADITAGQAVKLKYFLGAISINDQTGLIQTMPLPHKMTFGGGATISSVTTNLQTDDQYSDIVLILNVFYL